MILPESSLMPLEIGGGGVQAVRGGWQLTLPVKSSGYADAQIDDCRQLPRAHLPWSPPVELSLRARTSRPDPVGTLGFGFWNDPFALSLGQAGAARKLPASPQALWFFFGSEPNDLSFSDEVPGAGLKAMSLRTPAVHSLLLALPAIAAFGLSYLPLVRGWVLRAARRIVTASEAVINVDLSQWHAYRLSWTLREARFEVDGAQVLAASLPPPPPLGFVAWIDNQYAIASPSGGLRFGLLPTDRAQSLLIEDLRLSSSPVEA